MLEPQNIARQLRNFIAKKPSVTHADAPKREDSETMTFRCFGNGEVVEVTVRKLPAS